MEKRVYLEGKMRQSSKLYFPVAWCLLRKRFYWPGIDLLLHNQWQTQGFNINYWEFVLHWCKNSIKQSPNNDMDFVNQNLRHLLFFDVFDTGAQNSSKKMRKASRRHREVHQSEILSPQTPPISLSAYWYLLPTAQPKKKKKVQFKTWEAQNHYTKLTPWAVLHTQIGWGAASGPEKWMKPGSWMVLVLQVNRTLPDSSNRRFLSNCQFCWQGIACSYLKRSIQQNKIE